MCIAKLVIFFLTIIYEISAENESPNFHSELFHPETKCIPTATIHGPRHTCVCYVDGVYHCRPKENNDTANVTTDESRRSLAEITLGDQCDPGHVYKMVCNRCYCTSEAKLLCTQIGCGKTKKRRHSKSKITKITVFKESNLTDAQRLKQAKKKLNRLQKKLARQGNNKRTKEVHRSRNGKVLPELPTGECEPGRVYKNGCKRCYCGQARTAQCALKSDACPNKKGVVKPITSPEDVRPPFSREELKNVPTLATASEQCVPGLIYQVSCNLCVCVEKGNLLCSKELCLSFEDMNRVEANEKSGEKCTGDPPQTKESCIDCKCVNGKLACVEIPNCFSQTRVKLSSGGRDVMKLKLDPKTDKCVPRAVYRENCNLCYCQNDGTLRCTQKTCLVYSQAKELRNQLQMLD